MKILNNFKPTKETIEGYLVVELFDKGGIFIDLPICAVDFGRHYERPVLYGEYKGIPTVYEEVEVRERLKALKLFHLKNSKGKLTEVPEAEADIHIRLPKDTNVDELVFENGEIFWAKPIDEGDEMNG